MGRKHKRASWSWASPNKHSNTSECPFEASHSSTHWLELETSRQWAKQDPTALGPINSGEREVIRQTLGTTEEAELARLLERALFLENLIQRKRAQLSPQRLLYHELLSEVFIQLAHQNIDDFAFPNAMDSPPAIFRVCKRWAKTAMATAELFSFIRLSLDKDDSTFKLNDRLKHWISLSQRIPLDISFQHEIINQARPSLDSIDGSVIWSTLLQQLPRWKVMICTFNSTRYIDSMSETITPRLSHTLEEFSIVLNRRWHRAITSSGTMATVLLDFPKLRKLHLKLDDIAPLSHLRITGENILTFSVQIDFYNEHFQPYDADLIHSFSSKIAVLNVRNGSGWGEIETICRSAVHEEGGLSKSSSFCLPSLKYCRMEVRSGCICMCLFTKCSKMKKLFIGQSCLNCLNRCRTDAFASITALELELPAFHKRPDDIFRLLSRLPALKEFQYTNSDWEYRNPFHSDDAHWNFAPFIEAFRRDQCCPHLTSLIICGSSLDPDELLEFVSERTIDRPAEKALLVTLHDCISLPCVIAADSDNLRSQLDSWSTQLRR